MSVKDEKRIATSAMGVSMLEHRIHREDEARLEPIAMIMRRRRLEWYGHFTIRHGTEKIRAIVEMKMEGKRPRGRPKLRGKDTIRRGLEHQGGMSH